MEELDDLGVPIKKKAEAEVDDLGVPLKKKITSEPVTSTAPTGSVSSETISKPSVADIPQFEKPQTLYPEAPTATTTFNPNQKYRDTVLDATLHTFQTNPIFEKPENRQIYYKRLASKGIKPAILDQVIHEGENAYLSPSQKLGQHVANIGTNTIEAPGQMADAGLKTLKEVPEAYNESETIAGGVGNAALQAVKGVGELAMGAASVTPPGVVFNAIANTASEVAPQATHAVMAPVTTFVLNNLYKDEPAPRWAQNASAILDFLTFAKGLHLASKGVDAATKVNDINKILNEVDPKELKAYSDKLEQQYGETKNVYEIPEKEAVDLDNNINAVKTDLQNNPDLAEILEPKLQKLTEDNDALQSNIAATAVQDAHIEAIKDVANEGIKELEAKKKELSPASAEAVDETINTLRHSIEQPLIYVEAKGGDVMDPALKGRKYESEMISPEDYIKETGGYESTTIDQKKVDKIKEKIKNGVPLDPITLTFKEGSNVGQEGRHRAEAARQLGIPKIPLVRINGELPFIAPSININNQDKQDVQEPTRSSASDAPIEENVGGEIAEPKEVAPKPVSEGVVSEAKPKEVKPEEPVLEKPKDEVGKTVSIIHAGMKRSGEITEIKDGQVYVKDKAGTVYNVKPSDVMKEGESFDDAINRINKKRRHEAEPEPYQKKISDIKVSRKALLDQLKKDTSGQLNAGIDPSHIPTLIKIGKTYLEEGAVHFEHFAKKLYEDLKGLGIRFNRNDPEFQKDVAHIYNESKKQRFENISPDVALSVQRKAADLSEAKIKQAKRKTWDKFYKGFVRHIEDIAGNVKEALRNAGGEEAVMMKDIANKSNGKASLKIEELNKKIFHGLKEPELKDLGNIIQAKRTIQLDEMYDARKQPRLNHELGHTKEFYEAVLDGMEKENPEQFKKLSDKADDYFKAMQDLLKDKKENGLIDKAAYELLKEQSMYSPRAFIQHMDQIENGFNNKNAVSNNGIKKLDEGSEGLLDKDPQFLLANAVSRAYSLMAKNDAAKSLLEFAENNPDNGVVEPRKISGNTLNDKVAKEVNKFEEQKGVTLTPAQIDAIRQKIIDADYDKKVEEFADKYNKQPTQLQKDILKEQAENGENTYAPVPSGKEVISAFVDGHKRDMLMDRDKAAEWMGTDPAISAALGEAVQWLTGANLLRYTATGVNPAFALANAPRDMAYIYLTTDGTYSKHLPVFVKQIHQDMATVASDAIKRTGRYKEFINEGGSIELLTHQGRFDLTKGVSEGVNKISHALGYIGETSELMTRLAMRERGIKNGTKEFEKQNGRPPTPDELSKIKVKATYDAVNQLDFSQGGDWSKALNKFVPYLNAAMQANRGLFREVKSNPKAFAYKAAQLATVAGGLTAYNLSQAGYDQISDDEKARYYIMMLGGLYTIDANGNKNYRYLKLAKSQETQFMSAVAENAVEFATTGKARPKEMMLGLKNQMPPIPFLTQDVPMAEMLRTYESNYDRFYDRKLWGGQEGLSPELEFNPAGKYKTPEIYRKLGETTGLSPERVRGSLPKLLVGTERNPFMTIPGKVFQVAAEGMGITERDALNKTFTQNLDDMFKGTYSKFYGETNPMRKTGYDEDVLTAEMDAKKKMNDDVKSYIDKNLGKDVDKDKAVAEFREFVDKKYKDAEPKERARMVNSFRTGLQDSKLDYWYVKLSNYSTDSRAKIFKNRYDSTSESEREDMRKIMKENIDINTPAFRNKLKAMGFKDDLEPDK